MLKYGFHVYNLKNVIIFKRFCVQKAHGTFSFLWLALQGHNIHQISCKWDYIRMGWHNWSSCNYHVRTYHHVDTQKRSSARYLVNECLWDLSLDWCELLSHWGLIGNQQIFYWECILVVFSKWCSAHQPSWFGCSAKGH